MAIRLGEKVTDCITGFTGVAWSRISYITGPDKIGVFPKSEDGCKLREPEYFDEDRLTLSLEELTNLKASLHEE